MSLSVIVQRVAPGGICNDAVPFLVPMLNFISTLRSAGLCWMVKVHPDVVIVPVPVASATPPQQKRYSPVDKLNNTVLPGLESSCRQPLKTFTGNEQVTV